MKKGKKVLSLLLCAAMTLGLAACGKGGGSNGGNGSDSPASAGGNDAAVLAVH